MAKPATLDTRNSTTQSTEWPALPWADWQDTITTLHMWMQVIGKIRLALAIRTNHWWHVTLYPTSRGLTTSPMPYDKRTVQIDFDFVNHQLLFQTSDGMEERLKLAPMSVADFYAAVLNRMDTLNMPVQIRTTPAEVADPVPFEQDHQHAAYDADAVNRFWKALSNTERVFTRFRARFLGKVSPVHFFWGGFDLAMTRFSGRPAPVHGSVPFIPDAVVQTAYSHEVSSCGFWPGGPTLSEPVFYAYAYPAPNGFGEAKVLPKEAYFHPTLGEFILPYEAVRQSSNPEQMLMDFLQSTYEAAAELGHWDRQNLEASSKEI